jgi:hypothetical protein
MGYKIKLFEFKDDLMLLPNYIHKIQKFLDTEVTELFYCHWGDGSARFIIVYKGK